jgi:hypothetical protein
MDTIQQRLRALGERVASAVGTDSRRDSFRQLASEPLVSGAVPYGLGDDVSTRSRVSDRVQPVSSREAYAGIAADRTQFTTQIRKPRSAGDSSVAAQRLSPGSMRNAVATALSSAQEASQLGLDLLALPPSERDILLVDELAVIASTMRAVLEQSSDGDESLAAGVDALDVLNTVLDELRHQASSASACSPQAAGVPSPRQPPTPRVNELEVTSAVLEKPLIEL